MNDNKKPLSFSLNGLKPGSKLDEQKVSAFQVAPARKNAFDKSREDAQRKADKEAAETAAALREFEAEYGVQEEDERDRTKRSHVRQQLPARTSDGLDLRLENGRNKRAGSAAEQSRRSPRGFAHDVDSEEEERDWKRTKMQAGSNFLETLKHSRQERQPRQRQREPPIAQDKWQSASRDQTLSTGSRPLQRDKSNQSSGQESTKPSITEPINEEEDESGDDVDYYRTKAPPLSSDEPLNKIHRKRLEFLLDTLTVRRGSIARLSAFAMVHASSVHQVSDAICANMQDFQDDWKRAITRLWCISDILHNSWIPIPNVWKYRGAFETRLPGVIAALKRFGDGISSRIRRENFRRLVLVVLNLWNTWICFSAGVMENLHAAFDEREEKEEIVVEKVQEKKKSGGWKKVDGSKPREDAPVSFPSRPYDDENDGEDVNLDGEQLDLDGEDINLDGDATDLDADMHSPPHNMKGGSTAEDLSARITRTHSSPWQENDVQHATIPSVQNAPKIKMTFGKVKLAPRGSEVLKTTIAADQRSMDSTNNSAPYAQQDLQNGSESKHPTTDAAPGLTDAPNGGQAGRAMRRRAADFMD